jgi:lysozyme family protein
MVSSEEAIELVLKREGEYYRDSETGEESRWGIDKRSYPDAKIETREDAKEFYKKFYWLSIYEKIESQRVVNLIFSLAVNMGHAQAHKLVQRALNEQGANLVVDGVFGPKTLEAVNNVVLLGIKEKARAFYRYLAANNPVHTKHLKGWLARIENI